MRYQLLNHAQQEQLKASLKQRRPKCRHPIECWGIERRPTGGDVRYCNKCRRKYADGKPRKGYDTELKQAYRDKLYDHIGAGEYALILPAAQAGEVLWLRYSGGFQRIFLVDRSPGILAAARKNARAYYSDDQIDTASGDLYQPETWARIDAKRKDREFCFVNLDFTGLVSEGMMFAVEQACYRVKRKGFVAVTFAKRGKIAPFEGHDNYHNSRFFTLEDAAKIHNSWSSEWWDYGNMSVIVFQKAATHENSGYKYLRGFVDPRCASTRC